MASSAVRSRPATPRTPSVPKRRPNFLALAVLRSLAGLLQSVLLALGGARVTGEEAGLLERRAVRLDIESGQPTGQAHAQGAGLTGDAATVDARDHVERLFGAEHHEGLVDDLLVNLVREVVLERTTIDRPLAGARHDADAGDRFLAAAGAVRVARDDGLTHGGVGAGSGLSGVLGREFLAGNFQLGLYDRLDTGGLSHGTPLTLSRICYWAIWVISNGTGCWARCGCSDPA